MTNNQAIWLGSGLALYLAMALLWAIGDMVACIFLGAGSCGPFYLAQAMTRGILWPLMLAWWLFG